MMLPKDMREQWEWRRRGAVLLLVFGIVTGVVRARHISLFAHIRTQGKPSQVIRGFAPCACVPCVLQVCTAAVLGAVQEEAAVVQLAQELAGAEVVAQHTVQVRCAARARVGCPCCLQQLTARRPHAQSCCCGCRGGSHKRSRGCARVRWSGLRRSACAALRHTSAGQDQGSAGRDHGGGGRGGGAAPAPGAAAGQQHHGQVRRLRRHARVPSPLPCQARLVLAKELACANVNALASRGRRRGLGLCVHPTAPHVPRLCCIVMLRRADWRRRRRRSPTSPARLCPLAPLALLPPPRPPLPPPRLPVAGSLARAAAAPHPPLTGALTTGRRTASARPPTPRRSRASRRSCESPGRR